MRITNRRLIFTGLLLVAATPCRLWSQDLTHIWSQRFGGGGNEAARSVAVDATGNVVISGYYTGDADFGGGPLGGSGRGVFVGKYTPGGMHLWSQGFADESSSSEGTAVAVDGTGNVCMTGFFDGSIDFGGGTFTSRALTDIFIARFDASGTHTWSKSFGDFRRDEGGGIAADAMGNVYVSGYFEGTIDFGGGFLTGFDDIFIAKYGSTGTHVWSKQLGVSNGSDRGRTLTLDPAGNPTVTGIFLETLDFGGGPITSAGSFDAFVAKYDPAGNHTLSRGLGGNQNDQGYGVAADAAGNVVVTGRFEGAVDFGGGSVASAGESDIFVAKYDASGNHVWSRTAGSDGRDLGLAVALTDAGNVIVTGSFAGTVNFGGDPLTSAGSGDIFVAGYGPGGNHLWSQRFGDAGIDQGRGVVVDGSEFVVTGSFAGGVDFGGDSLMSAGGTDAFAAKFSLVTVSVTLLSYAASWIDDHIEVSWRLFADDVPPSFAIARAAGSEEAYSLLRDAHVERRGDEFVFTDHAAQRGTSYRYRVVVFENGEPATSFEVTATAPSAAFTLEQNLPNPFNPSTIIRFTIEREAHVRLGIYDAVGHRMTILLSRRLEPGTYTEEWDGRDAAGHALAGGVYFYQLDAGGRTQTRKAILLK